MADGRDLFGVMIDRHHGQRGRPRHKPTEDMRRRVREMREGGATLPTIAAALHITEPTLMLHYREQLGWRQPRHKSAADIRQRVRELRGGGATLQVIATALHISERTLVRHYREEVGWGRRGKGQSTEDGQ